jgi:glycine betaine catabolism B
VKAIIIEIVNETQEEISSIRSFRLKPESRMKYTSGQWMYVRINEDLKHHFTISSSPTEEFLQFTTKFRPESAYKQALWNLKVNATLEITGPFGSFVLDALDTSPKLFIAGGIGITPFRSMLKYSTDKSLSTSIVLLYSVNTKAEAAFPNLPFAHIIESSLEGRLASEKIKKYCPDWQKREWWVCGPPAMVEATIGLAQKMGIETDKIKSEEFTGY